MASKTPVNKRWYLDAAEQNDRIALERRNLAKQLYDLGLSIKAQTCLLQAQALELQAAAYRAQAAAMGENLK
jgi:hypothetical protein